MHFFFIVREFNSIDHMVPIIWKLKKFNITVLNVNFRTSYLEDCRIKFIKDNVKYLEINDVVNKISFLKRIIKYIFNIEEKPRLRIWNYFLNKCQQVFEKVIVKKILKISLADINLESIEKPSLLIIDHGHDMVINHFVKIFKNLGVHVLSVPHAVENWNNIHHDDEEIDPYKKHIEVNKEVMADKYICVSNQNYKSLSYQICLEK